MNATNKFSENEINNLFSRIATNYDAMNNIVSLGTQNRWRRKFFKMLKAKKGDFCLDLCAGTGDLSIELAKEVGPSGNVIAYDFNKNMLKIARQKVIKADVLKEVQFKLGDAMALPYSDASFDIVTIGFGLRNVPDAKQVIAEAHRVLKPKGKLGVLETSKPTSPLTYWGWQQYLKLIPKIAKIAGKATPDYYFLTETAKNFATADALTEMLLEAHFKRIDTAKLNFGAGTIQIAYKN